MEDQVCTKFMLESHAFAPDKCIYRTNPAVLIQASGFVVVLEHSRKVILLVGKVRSLTDLIPDNDV